MKMHEIARMGDSDEVRFQTAAGYADRNHMVQTFSVTMMIPVPECERIGKRHDRPDNHAVLTAYRPANDNAGRRL